MIRPATVGSAPPDVPPLELDLEVALRLDGYHWVRWLEGESPDPPRESGGRFLARRDGPLAHIQVPAPPSTPLAPQPHRNLPRYSLDPRLALSACERVGLFRSGGVGLEQAEDGTWILRLPSGDALMRDASLPRLLTRAALRWHALQQAFRQELQ